MARLSAILSDVDSMCRKYPTQLLPSRWLHSKTDPYKEPPLYLVNLPPFSATYNKCMESRGCWYISTRAHGPPSPRLSVHLSVLSSLLVASNSSTPKPSGNGNTPLSLSKSSRQPFPTISDATWLYGVHSLFSPTSSNIFYLTVKSTTECWGRNCRRFFPLTWSS